MRNSSLDWVLLRIMEEKGWRFLNLDNALVAHHPLFFHTHIYTNDDLHVLLAEYNEEYGEEMFS